MKGALDPTRPRRATATPDPDRWLEALPIAVIGVDEGERVRFVNAAAADLFAPTARGLTGRTLMEVFGSAAPVAALARAALDHGQTVTATDMPIDPIGALLGRADISAAPLEGKRFAVLSFHLRGRAQNTVEARPVSAAARALAHEVRNPLAGIRAAAQLIGKGADDDTAALADLICDEVDRIRRLTDRIDALEGLGPPNLAPVNVHRALNRVRQIIASTFPGVLVRERYDPSLPQVSGDLDQLIQAFLNLAKNAAEAVRGQGEAVVTLRTAFRPGVRVRLGASASARPQLEVAVEDNGPGLPAVLQSRVFEPFVTTKRGGQGLGLAVTAEIVARHDGRIEVESAPGRTVFRVLLPIVPDLEAHP